VTNTLLEANGSGSSGAGIIVQPSGSGSAQVVLDSVRVENSPTGIFVNAPAGSNGLGPRETVETVLEDGVDVAIGAGLDGAGPSAGRFEPLRAVPLGQAQDAQAGAIALFGMRTVREDRLDQREIAGLLDDWRRLLRGHFQQARQILTKLLRSPLALTLALSIVRRGITQWHLALTTIATIVASIGPRPSAWNVGF
jgi:hypothetical protein